MSPHPHKECEEALLPLDAASEPAPKRRSRGADVIGSLITLAILLYVNQYAYLSSQGAWSGGSDSVSAASRCLQVAPLQPASSTEELDRIDELIWSEKFRNASVDRLSGAVQIPSESRDDMGEVGDDDRWDIMFKMADYLEKSFPAIYKTLTLDKVNTHGLLYTWQGSEPSLRPVVLMAHQDVVPVAPDTVGQWTYPPYSGAYDGQFVWGRGSSDCKSILIGILESVELLIDAGFQPRRTIILSFGFDEEVSGHRGAGYLAPVLFERYGKHGVAAIVDEGASLQSLWGTLFALPGVAEKGYLDVEIIVRMPGGHSSIPPLHTGIGVMSELVTLIEGHPYTPALHEENPFLGLLQCAAAHSPEFPSSLRKLLPHGALDTCARKKDKLAQEAAKLGDMAKYLFTTSVAVDIVGGGVKVNALPERTRVVVNHRINVGESSSQVLDKLTSLAGQVAKKYNLTVDAFTSEPEAPSSIKLRTDHAILEPAPVTPTLVDEVTAYSVLSGTTRSLYGEDTIVAPGIMTGNTDTRYYWDVSENIFRFFPGYDPELDFFTGIHTVNEKTSVLGHLRAVQWYTLFLRNMDEAELA